MRRLRQASPVVPLLYKLCIFAGLFSGSFALHAMYTGRRLQQFLCYVCSISIQICCSTCRNMMYLICINLASGLVNTNQIHHSYTCYNYNLLFWHILAPLLVILAHISTFAIESEIGLKGRVWLLNYSVFAIPVNFVSCSPVVHNALKYPDLIHHSSIA